MKREVSCRVFELGADETPGDTVCHSDDSHLITGSTLQVHAGVGLGLSAVLL